jgi:hypothetical protein
VLTPPLKVKKEGWGRKRTEGRKNGACTIQRQRQGEERCRHHTEGAINHQLGAVRTGDISRAEEMVVEGSGI